VAGELASKRPELAMGIVLLGHNPQSSPSFAIMPIMRGGRELSAPSGERRSLARAICYRLPILL